METALTLLVTVGIGGVMGLFTRIMLSHGVRIVAAATDNPYVVTMLVGAVTALFGSLTWVAKLLLQRTDKAHADLIASMIAAHIDAMAGKDAVIAATEARCDEMEQRASRYETLVLRSIDAAKEAAHVATAVVTNSKRGAP
jgi:hypothetical protein